MDVVDEAALPSPATMALLETYEPTWPDTWTCRCPCLTVLQGGRVQFHRHWLVVHLGKDA